MILAWRLVEERHKDTAYSGIGAQLYGGLWNSKGIPIAYSSSSQALALWELFVQQRPMLVEYQAVWALIPE